MGVMLAKNVAVLVWPKLGRNQHLAARALMAMALTAKDSDRNPRYFAGSEALNLACGYDPGDEAGHRAVRRALRDLQNLGYIEQVEGLPRHWKRRWLLNIPEGGVRSVPDAFEGPEGAVS